MPIWLSDIILAGVFTLFALAALVMVAIPLAAQARMLRRGPRAKDLRDAEERRGREADPRFEPFDPARPPEHWRRDPPRAD